MMRSPTRPLAWLLSLMLVILPVLPAQAAMVGTGDILNQQQTLADDRLQQFLDREATRAQLQEWGVSAEWVETRLNSLTDAELARIHSELDNLEAGGSILGILLIIFIVFVITDVIGATDIFPFIHPVK